MAAAAVVALGLAATLPGVPRWRCQRRCPDPPAPARAEAARRAPSPSRRWAQKNRRAWPETSTPLPRPPASRASRMPRVPRSSGTLVARVWSRGSPRGGGPPPEPMVAGLQPAVRCGAAAASLAPPPGEGPSLDVWMPLQAAPAAGPAAARTSLGPSGEHGRATARQEPLAVRSCRAPSRRPCRLPWQSLPTPPWTLVPSRGPPPSLLWRQVLQTPPSQREQLLLAEVAWAVPPPLSGSSASLRATRGLPHRRPATAPGACPGCDRSLLGPAALLPELSRMQPAPRWRRRQRLGRRRRRLGPAALCWPRLALRWQPPWQKSRPSWRLVGRP
mmetsp:Transcript_41443/g.130477  ORF Transcript_41443/g.130477 Transcript_41443/m.130477 type:complete len:331 (+) Transcript_41443:703-1695(+)